MAKSAAAGMRWEGMPFASAESASAIPKSEFTIRHNSINCNKIIRLNGTYAIH